MSLDDGYHGITSRVELQSSMLALLKIVDEMADMYNRKAEVDNVKRLKKGKLAGFIQRVEKAE